MITLIAIVSALICVLILVIAIRSLTVLLHELGHAIPAMVLTRARVTVYVGSYGDTKKCLRLRVGLLEIWMKYFPFWNKGVCVPSKLDITNNKKIIFTLGGPVMSLFTALIAFVFIYFFEFHNAVKAILLLLLTSSIIDFLSNITPKNSAIKLHNGKLIHNDGYQLKQLFYLKRFPKQLEVAVELLNNKEYVKAANRFEYILSKNVEGEDLYRLVIWSFICAKLYEKALDIHKLLEVKCTLNSMDYNNAGIIKSYLDLGKESITDYEKSISLDPKNHYALNNRGYQLNVLELYHEAIVSFDKAIENDPAYAYSYNNRGLAKLKLGRIEEGLADIEYSMTLDRDNAYAHKKLGIYHLDRNEIQQAKLCFDKAKKLDADTHGIDKLIEEAGRCGQT